MASMSHTPPHSPPPTSLPTPRFAPTKPVSTSLPERPTAFLDKLTTPSMRLPAKTSRHIFDFIRD
ncbi:hypothetical protein HGRIS_000304 [Hohenbuehelia grisea]|uniref:Uncharacterized protein n=1 Tax=Hohenbuehelia grisea TaxID=104357 RepID=A0ABR3JSN2_9AGAR